jgi:hypothetical protein
MDVDLASAVASDATAFVSDLIFRLTEERVSSSGRTAGLFPTSADVRKNR